MTAFDGCRESWEAAAPRSWLVVRRLVQIMLGIVCGSAFAIWLLVILP